MIIDIKLVEFILINLKNIIKLNKKYNVEFIINNVNKNTKNKLITNLIYNLITNEDIFCISHFLSDELGNNIS